MISNMYGMARVYRCIQHTQRVGHCRTLFTASALGIEKYQANRKVERIYSPDGDEARKKFLHQIEESVPLKIFERSFKRFAHLIENVDEDIELLWRGSRLLNVKLERELLRPITEQQPEYHYGPLIMQALSYLRLPIIAKEFFLSAITADLFNHSAAHRILLDLLYDERMYGEVIECYAEIKARSAKQNRFICGSVYTILVAAYYRLNNPTHDREAFKLCDELNQLGVLYRQYSRTAAILGALRLKHKQPQECLELLSGRGEIDVQIRYMRIMAHVQLNEFPEVIRLIRLTITLPLTGKSHSAPKIPDQLLQQVGTAIAKSGDKSLIDEFKATCNEIKKLDRIIYKGIPQILCSRFSSTMFQQNPKKN